MNLPFLIPPSANFSARARFSAITLALAYLFIVIISRQKFLGRVTYHTALYGLYTIGIIFSDTIGTMFSERIKSQGDLERIAAEEAEKLGMSKSFKVNFHNSQLKEGHASKLDDGTYEINIGHFGSRRSIVRHELYHIHRGHSDDWKKRTNLINILYYYFRWEPQAVVYEVFRIKL